MVIVVMGVSGCGKSAVGAGVARRLGWRFFDGDDFHSAGNREKMSRNIPLDDADRGPWLALLAEKVWEWNGTGGAVLACSALRRKYRDVLRGAGGVVDGVVFVFLEGDEALIRRRMEKRPGHFMPAGLLESQLATLERPGESAGDACVTVGIDAPLAEVVEASVGALREAGVVSV